MNAEARVIYDALREAKPQVAPTFPSCTVDCRKVLSDDDGRPHGAGVIASAMGFYYEGDVEHGRLVGSGMQRWCNGCVIKGQFDRGSANGRCEVQWPSGDAYDGQVRNSVRHGEGTHTSCGGAAVYTGAWRRGRREGHGRQAYRDGSSYEGLWLADARHGTGRLRYCNGDCYDGEWSNNERHGYGVMGWTNGTPHFVELYEGQWRHGLPDGEGRSTYIRLVGGADAAAATANESPKSYAPPGTAIINVYHGQLVEGIREGRGTFYYADGSSYEGEWRGGKKNGLGTFTTSVGTMFYGTFVDDRIEEQKSVDRDTPNGGLVFISDMGGLVDGSADQLRTTVKALLLRYNTVLKALFNEYSVKRDDVALIVTDPNWWRWRVPNHISLPQFVRLLSDCGLVNGPVGLSTVLRCVVQTMEALDRYNAEKLQFDEAQIQINYERRMRLYRFEGCLNFRTFTECLVRLSPHVSVGASLLTLGEKFNAMMQQHLAPADHPLCPVTRRYAPCLAPHVPALERQFHVKVDLELNNGERFLSMRSFMQFVMPLLQQHKIDVGRAVSFLFTS
ncbi:hypothetical protein STCU_07221 [Strigomonas culicis]|uniref:Phosphatidylinositol-4-phosphate 5-kinase n=1 Tax=Strigomonas culicis TaxID=28005 RepID=S9U0R2_9TRYP|nr:hypothetical protein STCU_07221 [Strigomonas culicis]|eukprot:EPY24357.1 hypothetical protein STCU_07221 [Strigomonas culicis]